MHSSTRTRTTGFTLIELLVVIAIIAILAAILFPVFAQARAKARQTSCLSNMKQIMTAVRMYDQDYDEQSLPGWYTPNVQLGGFTTFCEILLPYIKNQQIFICPSASLQVSAYTTGCTAAPSKLASSYIYPQWLRYTYYGAGTPFDPVEFAGFPDPKTTDCVNPWESCVGAEFATYPAEAVYIMEGYLIAYAPATGFQMGSACTIGFGAETNTAIFRHNLGGNFAFCDGHAKWLSGSNFMGNASSRTTGTYSGYPQSPYMRVGP